MTSEFLTRAFAITTVAGSRWVVIVAVSLIAAQRATAARHCLSTRITSATSVSFEVEQVTEVGSTAENSTGIICGFVPSCWWGRCRGLAASCVARPALCEKSSRLSVASAVACHIDRHVLLLVLLSNLTAVVPCLTCPPGLAVTTAVVVTTSC